MTNPRPDRHPEVLLAIDAPHFYCGVILRDDRVIQTAPIVRYLHGWSAQRLIRYGQARGWRVENVTLWRNLMEDQLNPTSTTMTTTADEAVREDSLDRAPEGTLDEAGWQTLMIQVDHEEGGP